MEGLGYSRTVAVTLVHGILRHRYAYIIMYGRVLDIYSRTIPVTLVHGILRHRCAYIIWTVFDIPGLSQLLWYTGYSDTGVHTIILSWIFQDCPSYFGARNTQTQVCIHNMDGLRYSRTVPVTLVHGILRHRGAYNTLLRMDGLGYSKTVPCYFGTRDTYTQGCVHYVWTVLDIPVETA